MRYLVAPVRIPLDSVSQICDTGATVTFHQTGGVINNPDGSVTKFGRDKNTYVREMWVERQPKEEQVTEATFNWQSRPTSS